MPGATAPLGFFDPLGFTKGANAATLSKYREAEIKHGRVAMLAVFGILTAEKFHPLYDGKLSGNPLEAWANVPQLAKLQIFLFCGFLEFVFNQVKKNENYKVFTLITHNVLKMTLLNYRLVISSVLEHVLSTPTMNHGLTFKIES